MPVLPGKAFLILACHGGVELDHWFATFNGSIRSARNYNSRLDEAFPRISTTKTLDAQTTWCEEEIANRMRRLHRRNNPKLYKPRDVCRVNNLSVLNSPSGIGNLAFGTRYSGECSFVFIKNVAIRFVSDRMSFNLNPFAK